ncbi:MAG TPA: hypothetical protein V6C97_03835 [Oculatellaceae cyanobacterium]
MPVKRYLSKIGFCLLVLLGVANLAAFAFDSLVYNNLSRSRQALLDQRAHLQESADRIGRQIDNLNHQLDTVNSYLRDTDTALRDVETSMANAR